MTAEHETADQSVARLRAQCAAVGFDLDKAGSSLVERMRLLAECSNTCNDATRMTDYADRIFHHKDQTQPAEAFTPLERQTVVLACLFSDVGKTGPADADPAGRRLIAQMFAVENVTKDAEPVETFLREHFPEDAEERRARFVQMGLDPKMTVRQFWNLHSSWTLAIVEAAGLPLEAVAAAATHHLLDNVNPGALVGDDGRFTRKFGENPTFDRAEKLVIVLDKYDAARRRSGKTHEAAVAWLRERLAKSSRFHDDPEFLALLADASAVLGSPDAEA